MKTIWQCKSIEESCNQTKTLESIFDTNKAYNTNNLLTMKEGS